MLYKKGLEAVILEPIKENIKKIADLQASGHNGF